VARRFDVRIRALAIQRELSNGNLAMNRSNRFVLWATFVAMFTAATELGAQNVFYGGYRPYGVGPWGGAMPHGGTVAGSWAAGMGSMIQSQGAYNQMSAEAAIRMEEAKKLALDNKLKAAQTQYQLQRMNQENRAEQDRQRLTSQKAYTPPPPQRLTAEQFDSVNGKITWPTLLSTPSFLPERDQLDALFAERAKNLTSVSNSQITSRVLAMRDKLDAQHGRVPSGDFFSSRHFLTAVSNEARLGGYGSIAVAAQ